MLAIALLIIGGPGSRATAQAIQCRTNYYRVSGTNFNEIRQSILRARPWRDPFDAITTWQVTWNFKLESSGDGCRSLGFSTVTSISINMPWWVAPTNATTETRERWATYYRQLLAHEAGHARIAGEADVAVRAELAKFVQAGDCSSLRTQLNDAGNRAVARHRELEKDYDRKTRHGAEQDAK